MAKTTATKAYRVECSNGGSFKKSRTFRTVEQAVDFANRWHDDHFDHGYWDVQIITPGGAVHQTNPNGNTSAASIGE